MHYRDGIYYMSYSHGRYDNDTYSVHYCTSSSPVGPWTYQGEILATDGWYKGPGHHSFVYNAAMDEWYIVYHRWNYYYDSGPYSGSRSTAIEKIEYDQNGLIKLIFQTDTGVGPVWLGTSLLGDFIIDGKVDLLDLGYFADKWMTSDTKADIEPIGGNNIIDLSDFSIFSKQWLKELIN